MIEFQNIYKEYIPKKGDITKALDNISFSLPQNGMIFLLGKSGSGKSTLLNLIGCLDKPTSGNILVNGKTINNFKQSELDNYRNSIVGFVFQDYNLIESFNIYKNLELALNLQRKKISKDQINAVLNSVGLNGLGNRKVNELSGGQKQRVAIARALIKSPNIILADEPTGNLDSENGIQIFNILKEISKSRLVIIVTHDSEFAYKYGDRIIELVDGKINKDAIINSYNTESKELTIVKSSLSFLSSIPLSLSNLRKKKLRLFITIIIITFALSIFGFSMLLTRFDINRTYAEAMVNENETRVNINKKIIGKNFTSSSSVTSITKEDLNNIKSKLNNDIVKVSRGVRNNVYLLLNYPDTRKHGYENSYEKAYYNIYRDQTYFLEQSLENLNKLKIIGSLPLNDNEILINKIYADFILIEGLKVLGTDSKGESIIKDYYPESYDEIINSKAKILYGEYNNYGYTDNVYLTISGIVDEDISKYSVLKDTSFNEMKINPTKLYNEYIMKQKPKVEEVIVKEGFFDNLNLEKNNVVDSALYELVYTSDNKRYFPKFLAQTKILNKEIEMFNGNKDVKVSSIKDDEIILSIGMIEIMSDVKFQDKLIEFADEKKAERDKKVEERDKKVKEQEEKMLNDPDYVYKEIPELDSKKLMKDFHYKYIKDYGLIGKTVDLEINDIYTITNENKVETIKNLKVVGYAYSGEDMAELYNHVSSDLISKYMRDNQEISYIYFDENDVKKLENIFNEFPSNNAKFVSKTVFTNTINNAKKTIDKIEKISFPLSCAFLVFAIILFTNYIVSSINSNKKDIGIIKALGARTSGIFKIFYLESFLVGIISFILSSALVYVASIVANGLISSNIFFKIKPIIFRIDVIFYMFVLIIIVNLLSSIIPIIKLSKSKPIDVINNK